MSLAEVSVTPIGTPSPSVGDWIAESIRVLDGENVKYQVSPMGTVIEGETKDILKAVEKMHEAVFRFKISRVVTTIRIDDRRDKDVTMENRLSSIQRRLES